MRDRIDILVDLTSHMAGGRLLVFARKPAPVQISCLGYPASTGLPMIDYRITDGDLEPSTDRSHSAERPLRLSRTLWCYVPQSEEQSLETPVGRNGYVTLGSLNGLAKLSEPTIVLWSRILQMVKGSRLVLMINDLALAGDIVSRFGRYGVDANRLELVGRQEQHDYLRLYCEIDLALDPLPYNGHTTTCDALWMGVPVASLVGRTTVGRAGLSLLSSIGLQELVARDEGAYVELVSSLASDMKRLKYFRAEMRARLRRSPVMDHLGYTREVESLYREVWTRWCGTAS